MEIEITFDGNIKEGNYVLHIDVLGLCSSMIPGTGLRTPMFCYCYKPGATLLSILNSNTPFDLSKNETQIIFGEEWLSQFDSFKFLMIAQCEPNKIPPYWYIGDLSEYFSYTAKIKVGKDDISYKFNSLLDFVKFEYSTLFSQGDRICQCDYCGKFYKKINSNQKCCGAAECKKSKNADVRKNRESAALFKSKRNAVERIIKKYGNSSEEYRSFFDEYYKLESVLPETELISWCNKQFRSRAEKSTKNQHNTSKTETT